VLIVGYIFIESYFTTKEYPDLTSDDSLDNQRVSSVTTNRSASYVEFDSGEKNKISWGQNWNYDDFPTISELLSPGDIVSKKINSDTLKIKHSDKEYIFVIGHMIEKSK
jgi:hypothetical protein